MLRRIFPLASGLSLLFCAAAAVLWAGHFSSDVWLFGTDTTVGELHSLGSGWTYVHRISGSAVPVECTLGRFSYSIVPLYYKGPGSGTVGMECALRGPYWAVLLLTSILPVAWVVSRVRRKRISFCPTCPNCTYNLTGNTSGVCPECGAPISPSSLSS
ncbi:MAG TPA: hypothetical protein VIM11_03575 [Tepidisphaeraceae bacterium]|jgi:hypothetical protein